MKYIVHIQMMIQYIYRLMQYIYRHVHIPGSDDPDILPHKKKLAFLYVNEIIIPIYLFIN